MAEITEKHTAFDFDGAMRSMLLHRPDDHSISVFTSHWEIGSALMGARDALVSTRRCNSSKCSWQACTAQHLAACGAADGVSVMHETDRLLIEAQKRKLAEAVVDGRLQILKGVASIARSLGLSPAKTKRALEAGRIEFAWLISGKRHAIRAVLKDDAPQLPFPDPGIVDA